MTTASCGLLVIFGLALGAGSAFGLVQGLTADAERSARLVAALVALVGGGFAGAMLIHYLPWSLEWLLAMSRRCPECGARNWSFPFTEGFGL